jgi:hypothetical protein
VWVRVLLWLCVAFNRVWAGRWVRTPVNFGEVFSEAEVKPLEMTSLIELKIEDNAEF